MKVDTQLPFNTDLNQHEQEVFNAYKQGYEHGKRDYGTTEPEFETWEELEDFIINLGNLS